MNNTNMRYPQVKVKLVDTDGNAYVILANCSQAAKLVGVSKEEIAKFQKEAMAGDYDNLLRTCMMWFDCN